MCKRFDDFDEEAKRYKEIILNYRDKGEVFVDKNFHPTAKIPEQEVSFDESSTEWRRIDEVYDVPLFKEELIQIDYVKQGTLGDCYFLSAIIQLSQQPSLIPFLFDKQVELYLGKVEDSINLKCGAVVIYFHAFGRKTPVLIDTLIPFMKGTNTPLFSQPIDTTKSPWFCLIEKAYAKLNGSYTEVVGGSFSQAIYSLYGYYSTTKKVTELQAPEKAAKMSPFDRLLKYHKQGAIMGAAIHPQYLTEVTEEELTKKGLITIHSYLILKLKQFRGKNFICLRNPWGDHEWNGDWSDNSSLWTPEMKSEFDLKACEDGTFWMIDTDFFRYFTEIDISKPVPSESHSRSFFYKMEPGSCDDQSLETMEAFNQNLPRFAFQVTQDFGETAKCRLHILCERRHKLTKEKIPPYCVEIKSRHLFLIRVFQMAGKSQYISFPYKVLNENEMLVIHLRRLGKCSLIEDCYVKVFCNFDFKLIDVNKPEIEITEDPKIDSLIKPITINSPLNKIKSKSAVNEKKIETKKVEQKMDDKQEEKKIVHDNSKLGNSDKKTIDNGQNNLPPKIPKKPEKKSSNNQPPSNQSPKPDQNNIDQQVQSKDKSSKSPVMRYKSQQIQNKTKNPQSPQKPNSRQSQERPIKIRPIRNQSERPKISITSTDPPKQINNFPRQTEKHKKEMKIDNSPVFPPNDPKVVKAKPPKSIDLNDENIRKMYNSIRSNVFSSYLH